METGNVNLSISKEIVNPIVQAKIHAAVIEAMGGTEKLLEMVVDKVCNQKVDENGKLTTSTYNVRNWLDVAVTNQVQEAVKRAMQDILATRQDEIKKAIMKKLSSKQGIEMFAENLLSGLKLDDKYRTNIQVTFTAKGY